MTMDADYRPFHAHPSVPAFTVPNGAVDAHCHVFGPQNKFPYASTRKYTPCDAPRQKLFALRDFLGFSRNVIVQASCHGSDNSALVDALVAAQGLARGVAVVSPEISDAELEKLHSAGVRAIRFNFIKRLADTTPSVELLDLAKRIKKLDWHVVIYMEATDLPGLLPFLKQLPTKVIFDHMGRPDVTKGVDSEGFKSFIELLSQNKNFWTKVSCPERLSLLGPGYDDEIDYADVIPFARTLVDRFADRVLWGTDWPHPNMKSHTPDDGALVDFIPHIATDQNKQQALLVDNPTQLYWGKIPTKQGVN